MSGHRALRALQSGSLALTLCACQLAPPHERPPLPVPADYPEDGAGQVAAPALAWSDFFADPRLRALIASSLEHNRDLAIAVAQVAETRGLFGIQRADQLPTVGASADATRARGAVTRLDPVTGAVVGGSAVTDRYAIGVGVTSFELDFWGRVRDLTEAARAGYLAAESAQRAFRLSLIRDVATTYLAEREATERIELATATVEARREGLRIARRRLEAGVTSALDFRQAETLLTQAETELAALRLAQARDRNLLRLLVGQAPPDPLPEPVPLHRQLGASTLEAGLPSALLVNRPDIVAAEERLRAARADIGAARAAFFPRIALTGSLGYASDELDDLVGEDRRGWSFGPSIDVPIFDFGRRRANLDVARAREVAAVADYEATIQQAFREVADALAGRRFLADQVAAQERATIAQRHIAELARKRYREGVVAYLEVLDAERNLFGAEQTLLELRRAQGANRVSLYVALGGGAR